jgi:probable HAF family extracellular repeat protein
LPFGRRHVSARPYDINDMQQIVGETLFPGIGWRGFMYDMLADEFHILEPKFGVGMSVVNAINNEGIAVGARSTTKGGSNPHNAVIWDTNTGKITDLGIPSNSANSTARSINENGAVVGWHGGSHWHSTPATAFMWSDGEWIDLGALPGSSHSAAMAVNSNNRRCEE